MFKTKLLIVIAIFVSVIFAQNDGDTKVINGIEAVLVKAGSFMTKDTIPITLTEDFYISKYEITQEDFQAIMGFNPSEFVGDDKPVDSVTWLNAENFCRAVGGTLPTEAQWEFAARGGNQSKDYLYSGSNNLNDVAWHFGNSGRKTHSVGQKMPNELGIYDMSGNVWEWTADWYQAVYPSSHTNPAGSSILTNPVFRGGSHGFLEGGCRVSFRGVYPNYYNNHGGFRAAWAVSDLEYNPKNPVDNKELTARYEFKLTN